MFPLGPQSALSLAVADPHHSDGEAAAPSQRKAQTMATCLECLGEGCVEHPFLSGCTSIVAESPPDPVLVDCEHCDGSGECGCDDCTNAASEAAWERQCEDFHGGSSPFTLDEQHRAAWQQKQELSR